MSTEAVRERADRVRVAGDAIAGLNCTSITFVKKCSKQTWLALMFVDMICWLLTGHLSS